MKYCKTCLINDLRPNGKFMKDGNCFPCHYYKTKKINWDARLFSLKKIINKYKARGKSYDCLLGVSGGKDSTRQALWTREKLGLKPLLISVSYPPLQSTELGYQNLGNLLKLGFDIVTIQPAPQTACKLSKKAFLELGNILSYTELALFSQVPTYAIESGINLILWGENVSIQLGETQRLSDDIFDGNHLSKINTLSKVKKINFPSISSKAHLCNYTYPSEKAFKTNNISIVFLGPAIKTWSMLNNGLTSVLNGLKTNLRPPSITGDYTQVAMLDEDFSNINNMIKYYKFGFGRATDYVCESVRMKYISRNEAIKIIKKYDGVCSDKIIKNYCKYINIHEDEFWHVIHKFTNKHLFKTSNKKRPIPKFEVGKNYE